MKLSNQPHSGEVYYGVRIYDKNNKFIGSHNGSKLTKKIQFFIKDFFDIFIDELNEKVEGLGYSLKIETKTF